MAVETFVYLYVVGFGFSVFIGAGLLIAAARHISRQSLVDTEERQVSLMTDTSTIPQLGENT